MSAGVLLIDHGSRRAQANDQLLELAQSLERHLRAQQGASSSALPADVPVEGAHMELAEPTVREGVSRLVARGVTEVVVVPCMLSRGRHVTEDIPALVQEACAEHAGVTSRQAAPLVEQEAFVALLAGAAASAASD